MLGASSQLLFRAILSHVAVAIPPAFILGLLVLDANREGLIVEAQQVHLSSATRLAEAVTAELDARVAGLEEAERLLDAEEVPYEYKLLALRAVVAADRVAAIGLYDENGKRDSVVTVRGRSARLPETLAESGRSRARVERFATVFGDDYGVVMIAWRRGDRVLGFLAAPFEKTGIDETTRTLAANVLGPRGRVSIVDGRLAEVLSVGPGASSSGPFANFAMSNEIPALDAISAGFATKYQSDGERFLAGVVSVPDLGWIIGVSRPEAVALASVERVKSQVGLLALVAGLLAGVAALWLARYVTQPVLRLTRSVETVARSGFRGRVDVSRGGELDILQGAFNDALSQLHRYRQSLRSTTQLRLKIARFLPPNALHDVLTTEFRVLQGGQQTPMSLLYLDLVPDQSWSDVSQTELVAVLCDIYEAACGIVEEHGGQIDHFSGDSVIAIFVSEADESNANAAVATALSIFGAVEDIVARHGCSVPVAIGVATGEATMGEVNPTREVSVVGDLVDLVAELQQGATPGTVRVSPATHRLIDPVLAERDDVELGSGESE